MCHLYYYFFFFLQICGASWWRVCYQRGLTCVVSFSLPPFNNYGHFPPALILPGADALSLSRPPGGSQGKNSIAGVRTVHHFQPVPKNSPRNKWRILWLLIRKIDRVLWSSKKLFIFISSHFETSSTSYIRVYQ